MGMLCCVVQMGPKDSQALCALCKRQSDDQGRRLVVSVHVLQEVLQAPGAADHSP